MARRAVLACLRGLSRGALVIEEGGQTLHFGHGAPELRVQVRRPDFWPQLAFGGSVGAGESFMAGDWHCDDLTGLIRLLLANRAVADGMDRGLARLSAPLRGLLHLFRRNTRTGSWRNIAAHYDLGNDFYRLWLDETLMYSSAIFERPESNT